MYYALLLFIVYCFVLSIIINYKSDLVNKILSIILLTFITIVMGIRYGVGVDYFSYLYRFNLYYTNFSLEVLDYGIRYSIKTIFDKYHYYTFVMVLISNLFVYLGLRKRNISKSISGIYLLLSIFIFIADLNFVFANIMRQGVAVSIFFYCSTFISERNLKKYSMFILIGAGFHLSMLFLLPLYFILNKVYISKKSFVFLVITSYCLIGLNIAPHMLHLISEKIPFYNEYFNEEDFFFREYNIFSLGVMLKVLLALILTFASNSKRFNANERNDYNLYLIGIIFSILAVSSFMFSRIGVYFFILSLAAIPQVILSVSNRKIRTSLFILVLFVTVSLFTSTLLINPEEKLLEYKSIFSVDL